MLNQLGKNLLQVALFIMLLTLKSFTQVIGDLKSHVLFQKNVNNVDYVFQLVQTARFQ